MKARNSMNKIYLLSGSIGVFLLTIAFTFKSPFASVQNYKQTLSEYGFFKGNLANLKPAKDVIPYTLNTPLFSDYASKARFVKIPEGKSVSYNAKEVFDFPVGTILIKNFFYHKDDRKPQKGKRILETRLLIHESDGWVALPYIWNDAQTEASLDVAGDTKKVNWRDAKGKKRKIEYIIPNMNQCKGCHERGKKMVPIGPSARQLNGDFAYQSGPMNQLLYWQKQGILKGLPKLTEVPRLPVWNDPTTGSLDARARAWLDINCGHCHRPDGPANTSGLFLYIHEQNNTALGINKAPIAAGRAAGNLHFDIVPGKPQKSILVYRMESTDPGIMMPEIARQLVHKEGLALLKEWIRKMK